MRWAGLPDHPHHERAAKYLPLGPGAVFSFGVVGGRAGGQAFIEALELCSHLANTTHLVIHPPAPRTDNSDAALQAGGVPADLIRISVGIEDPDDIIWDIEQASPSRQRLPNERAGRRMAQPDGASAWRSSARRRPSRSSGCRPIELGELLRRDYLLSSVARSTRSVCNPKGGEILGRPVYRSLAELPGAPDLVDVFRRADDLPSVAEEFVAIPGARVFWAQLGLNSAEAVDIVTSAGRIAVMNRCLKIEHARFRGGLHQAGFDTGVISSKRRPPL